MRVTNILYLCALAVLISSTFGINIKNRIEAQAEQQGSSVPDGSSFYNRAGECVNCPTGDSGTFTLGNDGFLAEVDESISEVTTLEAES